MAQMSKLSLERYRVAAGKPVNLDKLDPDDRQGFGGDKHEAEKLSETIATKLREQQERLFAGKEKRVLLVLQAMDTGGKDGLIRFLGNATNIQGVRLVRFARPSERELARDYLWRVHARVPAAGEIGIFNRSHYEDVVTTRVQKLITPAACRRRYQHIIDFEQLLIDEGTTIIKCFLHISKAEQKERLQARLDDPQKQWKFDPNDLAQRRLWKDYMEAYGEAMARTSTESAPWYVIPADKKWYRNLVVGALLLQTLESLQLKYPKPARGLASLKIS